MQAKRKRKVFLTGGTGNWGRAILREFWERADRFDVVALVLPGDRRGLRPFRAMPNLTVLEGDLTDYDAVEGGVRGVDVVLHVGGVVSPYADAHPELTHPVNVGGALNLIRAVKVQPNAGELRVVMVGSVAQTGDRNPPQHWGRVGDPLRVSHFDEYGQSKVVAERALVDSGLARWAWLRQTGILHPGVLAMRDPIVTHTPLAGVLEWVSAEDSARLAVSVCERDVPDEFWGGIYNIGGGEGWRLTNWQFHVGLASGLGVKSPFAWFDRNWFATRNFHGHWFTDSDALEALVPFRRDTFAGAVTRAVGQASLATRLAGVVPAWLVKREIKKLALAPRGMLGSLRDGDEACINAYFGSHADWQRIDDWSTFVPPAPDRTPRLLQLGYDEAKPRSAWALSDMKDAATFRGGRVLSDDMRVGDLATPLEWQCALGHRFFGSPRLILTAGHWCPVCVRDTAGELRQAEASPFLAQVVRGATPS
jgi:nucleoside-diphosphate-sugar epimerase